MAQYHVGCGIAGIYAGTLKKGKNDEWLNNSDVTIEAIKAVIQYMYLKIPKGENTFAYGLKMHDGKYVKLKIEYVDECPEWEKGKFHED